MQELSNGSNAVRYIVMRVFRKQPSLETLEKMIGKNN